MSVSELSQRELRFFAKLSLDELDGYCTHKTARSSGPGGQSVNTTDSKVLTRFNPDSSIRATSQRERSQYMNRRANLKKIQAKLLALSTPKVERVETKPTRASQLRRLNEKTHRSTIKKSRTKNFEDE